MDNSNVFDSGYQMLNDTYELEKQHNIEIDKIENSEPFQQISENINYNKNNEGFHSNTDNNININNIKKHTVINLDLTKTNYIRNLDDNYYKVKYNFDNNMLSNIWNIPKIYIIFSVIFLIILFILLFL
jgi:hypothetical protein